MFLHASTPYQGHTVVAGLDDFLATININFKSLFQNNMRFQKGSKHEGGSLYYQNLKKTLHSPAEKAKTQAISKEGCLLLFSEQCQLD